MRFIGRILFTKIWQVVGALMLLLLALLASYVTYRHWTFLGRLPPVSWCPMQVAAPLSDADIQGAPVRWVEITVTASPAFYEEKPLYRNTLESPGTLFLHFKSDPGTVGRQTYRGLLQTYGTRRTRYRFPESLAQALRKNGIVPHEKFAVLSVNQSPWPLLGSRVKEYLVISSGLTIVLFLLAGCTSLTIRFIRFLRPISRMQWIETSGADVVGRWPRCCAGCGRALDFSDKAASMLSDVGLPSCPTCFARTGRWEYGLRLLVFSSASLALAWLFYRSLRYRPVIPAESLLIGGLSALFGLALMLKRWRVWRLHPLFVSQTAGGMRPIKPVWVHPEFLMALHGRSETP